MEISYLMNLLNEIEEKFAVDQWKIDGVRIWPVVRMDLMLNLYYSDIKKQQQKKLNLLFKVREGLKILHGFGKYLKAYACDHSKNNKTVHAPVVFLADGISRVCLKGRWFDKFCDPFVEFLEKNHLTSITLEPLHNYIIPRYHPSLFIQTQLDYALMKRMLFSKTKSAPIHLPGFNDFIEWLKEREFDIPLPDQKRTQIIWSAIQAYATIFEKQLKRIQPRLALAVSYYGPIGLAFMLACHRQKIPSIDIQHGLEGEFHPAYGRWNKVPREGYELLPSFFWCWGDVEVQAIEAWRKGQTENHKPIKGGNGFIHSWLDSGSELARCYDEKILKTYPKKTNHQNILLTLSYPYDDEKVLAPIFAAMRQSDPHWHWWVRLHPSSLHERESIRQMFIKNGVHEFNMDMATDLPLYALLRHTDVHLTHLSSTVIEAETFGVPSVVTGKNALQYYQEQIKKGTAVYADDAECILKNIVSQFKTRQTLKTEANEKSISEILKLIG